jgi:Phage tail tube protein
MPQSHGFDNTVVIGKESTFATPATEFKWAGIVESFEPEENNNTDQRRSVGVRAPFMLRAGAKEVDGTLSVALQNARLIAFALGKVATTGDGTTTPYTHTITPVGSGEELPSLTVQNHNALHNFTRNYVGGKVDTLTISASAEEAVTLEAEMLFSHVEDEGITPATVTAELDNYFMFYEGTVKINNASVANVTEFELEVNNNLERRFALNGQNKPARIEEGALEISASMTLDFTDKTQWDLFKDENTIVVELMLQDVADPDHSIKITLQGGMYDTNSLPVGAEDLQEQELEAVFTGVEVVAVDSNSQLI